MPKKLLIVDDMEMNRWVLEEMLSGDYELLEAADGESALEVLTREGAAVSAVLLDINMPVMDGYEALRRMRSSPALMQIPVIMMTGCEDDAARVKALSSGANDYVTKPYKPDVIKHCLETNIALHESSAAVRASQRDKLTGLYNREPFFELVGEMVSSHEPGYYIMACFDIDRFKMINDQYGMQKGDEVLRHIGETFRNGFVPNGGVCCRVSADNFAVLYPAGFQDSEGLKEMRRKATHIDGLATPIIFSIGRYVVDDLSMQPSAMYDRASLAADSVKGRYDGKIAHYDESMRERLIHEQEIVLEMERALRSGQFEVWFQPQYNHSTDAMIGAEALVRWLHPQKGLIPPDDFIPIFEQNGFIYALDRFVWEESCRYLRKWLDEGCAPLPVSVNISRYDVFCGDIIEVITGLVAKYDLPVELLRLEVTESAFVQSSQHIIEVVKSFVELGFTVEIDDFGSGYSSLNTLKDVPAQIIKLDMKFLENSCDTQRGGNIVESVVRMAKWLGMSVIAEGVETLEAADYLRSIGCSCMQGYLFARPMPAGEYQRHCAGAVREEKLPTLETVENLDNNSFWDPYSMDTLIFNSYVGGACIYEYHNGSIELLRATEKYAQVIGSAGMTVEDALKLNWADHMDEETRKRVVADLEESVATKKEVTGEYVFLDLPGCPHETYLRSAMRVIASAGKRYLVYCTNENITAQRQAERREHEVAEEMRLIMSNVNSGICATAHSPDGGFRVIFANDRFYSMYGYTKQQMESELGSVIDAVHPDDLEKTLETVYRLLRERGSDTYEYRCIKRDGSVITVSCSNSVTSFAGISDTVLLAVVSDVTEKIESERKIRSLSDQMQAIMDNVDLGILAAVVDDRSARYIFANNRYYSMLGYTGEQFLAEIHNPYQTISPEDRQRIYDETTRLNQSGGSVVLEYSALTRDKQPRFFRAAISIGSLSGIDAPVQLSIVRDITEAKEAEQRERRANEQIQAIMRDVDSGITATATADGKVLLLFSNDKFYSMRGFTREQYRAEVSDHYARIHPEDRARVKSCTDEAYAMQRSARIEYRYIRRDGETRWFRVALSGTHFTGVEDLIALSIYTDITEEKLSEQKIRETSAQLQNMMDDIPGGFVRMRVESDGSIRPVFFNDGFCKLTGMSQDELMDIYGSDAMAGVHPDDVSVVEQAVTEMMEKGEVHSARYRLIRKNGSYFWITFFGRTTKDSAGSTCLNIYYTDVTERVREEERQKELLDNLPFGAALYLFDGNDIWIKHLNKRYWELVERPETDYSATNYMNAVYPDDRRLILQEFSAAISQKRDVVCDIRILCGQSDYRPFHIIGRIIPGDDGVFSIYAAYIPVSDEGLSYQQMLPLLLSAMMESTSDLAFAKDASFRYISASRAFANMAGLASESDVVGKTDYELFSREIADKFRRDDESMLADGKPMIDMVEPIPPADGVPRYSSTSKYLLRDCSGRVVGLYGVGRDVTRAIAQETRLRLVTDTIPGGLASYVCTPGDFSQENVRLVYFNDGYCKLFGLTREEYQRRADAGPAGFVFEEDRHILAGQWLELMELDTPINCLYRVHVKGGGHKWISHKAVAADRQNDRVVINAILQDVTDQREMIEQLRISEEENTLAVQQGGSIIARFMIAERTLTLSPGAAAAHSLPETISNVPEEPIRLGLIAPDSAEAYTRFFESIIGGSRSAAAVFQQRYFGGWRWLEAKSSTIFSDEGAPGAIPNSV